MVVKKTITILLISNQCFAWGSVTLIPYLSQQITLMRESISVANKTLGEVKSLQRGLNDPISEADYRLRRENEDYRDLSNIYRGGKGIYKDANRNIEGWNSYFDIDSQDKDYVQVRKNDYTTDQEKSLIYKAEHIKDRQRQNRSYYEKLSEDLSHSSDQARSGAQAEKINAKAQSYLLKQGNDSLELQEYQLSVMQTQLANQKSKDQKQEIARKVEVLKIVESLNNLEPIE